MSCYSKIRRSIRDTFLSLTDWSATPAVSEQPPYPIYISKASLSRLEEHGGVAVVSTVKSENSVQLYPLGEEV